MFGRYSIYKDGLIYAGGQWNENDFPYYASQYYDEMVGKEVLQEVIPNDLPGSRTFVSQSLGNEIQIFLQRVRAVDLF